MKPNNVQNILNYYLEYEIYNIAISSQIKEDESNSYIMIGKIDTKQAIRELNKLKLKKIKNITEKFIGKRVNDREKLVTEVIQELDYLNSEQANQIQVVSRIKSLIREKIKSIDTKVIENFANQICDIRATREFWMYVHNISFASKSTRKTKNQPLFVVKCKIEEETIKVIDANINTATINTILSMLLNKEIADVSIEYEDAVVTYSKEIKSSIDSGDIEHVIDLFYTKLSEYIDNCLTRENIKNISRINNFYNMNQEYIISLDELIDEAKNKNKVTYKSLIKILLI